MTNQLMAWNLRAESLARHQLTLTTGQFRTGFLLALPTIGADRSNILKRHYPLVCTCVGAPLRTILKYSARLRKWDFSARIRPSTYDCSRSPFVRTLTRDTRTPEIRQTWQGNLTAAATLWKDSPTNTRNSKTSRSRWRQTFLFQFFLSNNLIVYCLC